MKARGGLLVAFVETGMGQEKRRRQAGTCCVLLATESGGKVSAMVRSGPLRTGTQPQWPEPTHLWPLSARNEKPALLLGLDSMQG